MGPAEVTAEWLSGIVGCEVRGVRTERIGDGLVGMNLRVVLDHDGGDDVPGSVIVKLPSPDPTSRSTARLLRTYEREVRFYLEVAPTVEIRLAACHHGSWDPDTDEFVLVLEDLHPARVGDQLTGCDVGHAEAAVDAMVRLHGPRWNDPSLDDLDWISRHRGPADTEQLKGIWEMVLPGFLSTYGTVIGSDGVDVVERFGPALVDWLDGRGAPFSVVHGDFRLDNLLFGPVDEGLECAAVDWQTPAHGPAVIDLAYFLGAGLLVDDRRVHERALVDRYAAGLSGYGIELDPGWLWEQYRHEAFAGVVMTVVASQLVARSDRSEAMFAAMATRHCQHVIDLAAFDVI